MICTRRQDSLWSYAYKPFLVILLVAGLFGLVWLRSSVVSMAYDIRTLEEKKTASLKEMKILLADRSSLMSVAHLGSSLRGRGNSGMQLAKGELVFPDRVRVVHVRQGSSADPKQVAFSMEEQRR